MSSNSSAPPTVDQLLDLTKRGFYQYILLPKICPCPMHDDEPLAGPIALGDTVVRSGSESSSTIIYWHIGCLSQNANHAFTGKRTFGSEPVRQERSASAIRTPYQFGTHNLPRGLSVDSTCAMTGESVFGFDEDYEDYADDLAQDILRSFQDPTRDERFITEDCGWPLLRDGHPFLARHNEDGRLTLVQSTETAAQSVLSQWSHLPHRDVNPEWEYLEGEKDCHMVIDLWKPYGPEFAFSEADAWASPRDWTRKQNAWTNLISGWPVDKIVEGISTLEDNSPYFAMLCVCLSHNVIELVLHSVCLEAV